MSNSAILAAIAKAAPKAYSGDGAVRLQHAKVLLLGPPKQGKTICLLGSAPAPIFVINCDNESALSPAIDMGYGDRFVAVEVNSKYEWGVARAAAKQAVAAGAKTVVLDSASFLCRKLIDQLLDEAGEKGSQRAYGELMRYLAGGINVLLGLEAHVFIVAHLTKADEDGKKLVPLISGQSREIILAAVNDVVRFDYKQGRDPERCFLLGPHEGWAHLCRAKGAEKFQQVEASVPKLFEVLGIKE